MLTRILTGIIGIIAATAIVTSGGYVFLTAVLLLSAVGWWEYSHMAANKGIYIYKLSGFIPAFLFVAISGFAGPELAFPVLIFAIFGVLVQGLYRFCHDEESDWLRGTSMTLLSILYTGLLFAHVPMLRNLYGPVVEFMGMNFEYGEAAIWTALLGTWSSDTFAYFFGVAFGKHKFCSVSPKKSKEGALAGFVFAFLVTAGLGHAVLFLPVSTAIVMGLAVAVLAPLGDLVESIMKRSFAIKDSGKIFPGHGGVLDRFDSLLFTVPVVYYVIAMSRICDYLF